MMADGIWAKLLSGEATRAANKATQGITRGKLADINSSYSLMVGASHPAIQLREVAFTNN